MRQRNNLASPLAVAVAIATLVGASAFADPRHENETRARDGARSTQSRGEVVQRPAGDSQRSQGDRQRSQGAYQRPQGGDQRSQGDYQRGQREQRSAEQRSAESFDRNRGSNDPRGYDRREASRNNNDRYRNNGSYRDNGNRNNDRRYDSRGNGSYRNNDSRRYDSRGGYGNGHQPYYAHGRVSRYERWNNGYRVWIGGALYPFYIPLAHWRLSPLRVGINVNLGGYYNPLGYYDYYDDAVGSTAYSRGDLRGTVESVDYRRGTAVVRDDASGDYVTVVLRSRDRLMDDLRPGDYVNFSGDWTGNGIFEAYRVDSLDAGAYRR